MIGLTNSPFLIKLIVTKFKCYEQKKELILVKK